MKHDVDKIQYLKHLYRILNHNKTCKMSLFFTGPDLLAEIFYPKK